MTTEFQDCVDSWTEQLKPESTAEIDIVTQIARHNFSLRKTYDIQFSPRYVSAINGLLRTLKVMRELKSVDVNQPKSPSPKVLPMPNKRPSSTFTFAEEFHRRYQRREPDDNKPLPIDMQRDAA